MAVSNKISKVILGGGGSSSKKNSAIDTSYNANLINLPSLNSGKLNNGGDKLYVNTNKPTLSGLNGAVLDDAIQNTLSPNLSNLNPLPNLSYKDNMAAIINGSAIANGSGVGGITDEGVIIGNPNVEHMPQINDKIDTSYGSNLTINAVKNPTGSMTFGEQLATAGSNLQQKPTTGTPATSGSTSEADSSGTTGGSTAGSGAGTVDSYEEFLLKQEGFYKEQLDKLNAQIEENKQNAIQQAELQRQETEAQAESERERGVIDARSSYAQNLATYGANAEALASMGLSGSGYSDYLTQQAYATQRAETQNANAQAEATKLNAKYTADAATLAAEQQANSDKLNAELSYAENLQNNAEKLAQYQQQKADEAKAEEEQKYQNYLTVLDAAKSGNYTSDEIAQIAQNYGFDEAMVESLTNAASTAQSDQKTDSATEYYAALLTSANSGDYTAEQLAELGKQYGLSDEQITSITDAANTYKANTQKSNYSSLMIDVENRATNKTILDTALKNDNISQEQYNDLLSRYQTNTYDDYSSVITADFSQADTSVIDNAYNRGEITKTQYNNLKTQYNKGVANAITAASLFYSNGAALDSSTANAIVDNLVSTGWLTQDTKNKINDAYNKAYNSDDGGCYAKGTMITVANGTQKAVEDIKVGDSVLVFNHLTGELDAAPISYVFHDGEKEYEVLKLHFGDATDVEVLFEHGFFDVDSKEYVLINPENAKDFVGHRFYRVTAKNGAYDKEIVTLTDYEVYTSQTECYAVVTAGHINSFANGMLSVTDDIKGLYNIFALDEDMKYDAQKMEEDIQKYGLFSYEDWKDFVSEEEFAAFNGAFLKVSIGKGLVTQDEIVGYIEKFLKQ